MEPFGRDTDMAIENADLISTQMNIPRQIDSIFLDMSRAEQGAVHPDEFRAAFLDVD